MYELIEAGSNTFYIQCPAKIGVIREADGQITLIDSGNDLNAGKKIRKIAEQQGWKIRAIINTHSHADHIGGNRYLQEQTGCAVYAPGIECDFTCHPILEPTALYGGNPPQELRHKFLMAQPSLAQPLTPEVLPEGAELIPLPGHSFDMVGLRTEDGAVFLADCLSSPETLAKYRIGYLSDAGAYLQTLEKVKCMEGNIFIPSHSEPAAQIAPLAQANIDNVHENAEMILSLCKQPSTFESLLQALFAAFELTMSFEQHALVGSTVRSYLTWLREDGKMQAFIENNLLLWQSK